jgi:16S rRNA (uracil1498-N3)-methyltransferase
VLPRFYAPDARAGVADLTLPADEAHHALRVMRLGVGDEIAVFDGRGREWRARITAVGKSGVVAHPVEEIAAAREARVPVTLLQAVLKGDHMDAVVRDAVMMGVTAIVPAITARTIARAGAASAARARERWQRVALASVKQCRRAVLPSVALPTALDEAIAPFAPTAKHLAVVLAEPATGARGFSPADATDVESAVLVAGPEGGWSSAELSVLAARGFSAMTLGAMTLRADAAALVAISMLRAAWKDL